MTVAKQLQGSIEEKLESIRQAWIEAKYDLTPAEREEIRRAVALSLDELKDILSD